MAVALERGLHSRHSDGPRRALPWGSIPEARPDPECFGGPAGSGSGPAAGPLFKRHGPCKTGEF
jgi:hypothetical protein